MKNGLTQSTLAAALACSLALATLTAPAQEAGAPPSRTLPADLQALDAIPPQATFVSIARSTTPPNPGYWLKNYAAAHPELNIPLYYSTSYGPTRVWVDDRAIDYDQVHAEAEVLAAADLAARGMTPNTNDGGGGTDGDGPEPMVVPPGVLYLFITNVTPQYASLVLTNTLQGTLYEIQSKLDLSDPAAWASEGFLMGNAVSTFTNLPIATRTNQLFLRARSYVPGPGQVYITVGAVPGGGNPFVVGINNLVYSNLVALPSPFPGTVFAITNSPLYGLDLGFHTNDDFDPTAIPPIDVPQLGQQNVIAVAGLDPAIMTSFTNFSASHNPMASLDLSGMPALQEIECFQATNLAFAKVSNCPNLTRLCLEQCALRGILDVSGDVALQDIRGAHNQYTNINFGQGSSAAGPNVWHLCVRENDLPPNFWTRLTNFFSLREWYMWNCRQAGSLSPRSLSMTNLIDVELHDNSFQSADFSAQQNLHIILMAKNSLTNLVITNCPSIHTLDASFNLLTTNALDNILAWLDSSAAFYGDYLDLTHNPEFPSSVGYAHYSSLTNHGRWNFIAIDWPGSTGGSTNLNDLPGGTNALSFVTTNQLVQPRIDVTAAVTNIVWRWGDGTTNSGTSLTTPMHAFGAVARHTNFVIVEPTSALTGFGAPTGNDGGGGQAFDTIIGLTNFPSLGALHLWNDGVNHLDISGCSALRHLYLAGNPCSSAVVDKWFIDLTNAVPGSIQGQDNVFYYPSAGQPNAPTAASYTARVALTNNYWNLQTWP